MSKRTAPSVWLLRPACLVACVLALACGEVQRAQYASYADAERAGAVERGWIPAYVPRSATDIAEAHDLDLSTQRLRFRIPAAHLEAMVGGMAPLPAAAAWPPWVRAPALDGPWPRELGGQSPRTGGGELRFYRAPMNEPGAHCLAVDFEAGVVYAWSCTPRVT